MRNIYLLILGLVISTMTAMAAPSDHWDRDHRGHDRNDHDGGSSVSLKVIIHEEDSRVSLRIFQGWFDFQVRGYDEIDKHTGKCLHDIMLLVTDVSPDRILVKDHEGEQREVLLTKHTELVFQAAKRSWTPPGVAERYWLPRTDLGTRLRAGDLVIVEGHPRLFGHIEAITVRVIGHVWGGYDDCHVGGDYGTRSWGEVRNVIEWSRLVELNTDGGKRILHVGQNADILADGKVHTLDYLRDHDHVVFYYRGDDKSTVEAYRVVVLGKDDRYPDGTKPYWTDPADARAADTDATTVIEGHLRYISTSPTFNKLVLRTTDDQEVTIRTAKEKKAFDRDGKPVSLVDLHDNELLRISYYVMGDEKFAEHIDIR